MKKLLLIFTGAMLAISLFAAPAFASPTQHGKFCIIYRNPDHSKQIKVCSELEQSDTDPGTWWARAEIADVSGYGEPYAVQTFTNFLSGQTSSPINCWGVAPACNTADVNATNFQPLDGDTSNSSPHLPYYSRYCYDQAFVNVLVYWNATQYGNGAPGDHGDILSDIENTNNGADGWCLIP